MKFHQRGRTHGNKEDKKIQGGNSLLSLEKEKGVELYAKGPSFKINTFYSISLFAVLSDHHKDTSSSIGASSCEMRRNLVIFLIAILCLIFLVFGCLDYPVLRCLSSAWGVSLSSAIKPFTSWDLPSCPARLVSIFQQQMHVLHNHSRAELQGDRTVRQDGKRAKKDVTRTRSNTTFHFVHCMLVRIVPTTSAGWGRRWQHHVVLHQQIFTLYHLFSSLFTLPNLFSISFPSHTGIYDPVNLSITNYWTHFNFCCSVETNITFLSVHIRQCWNYINWYIYCLIP